LFSGVLKVIDASELKEESIEGWKWFRGIGSIEILSGVAALLKPIDDFMGMNVVVDLCGVTELEALNILCGRNVRDYINKYTGKAEGRVIEVKEYQGEVQVVYKINDDERDIFS